MRGGYSEYYASIAHQFDELRLDREAEIQLFVNTVRPYLQPGGGPLLDVGSGTGRYTSALKACGYVIVAMDLSFSQLLHGDQRLVRVCATAAALPFASDTFNGLCAVMMIQQLEERDRASLWECAAAVVRPAGIICLKTSSHEDLRRRAFSRYFPSALSMNLARYPDIPTLEAELIEAGFGVLNVIPTFSEEYVDSKTLIASVERKHNSTLALLSASEFKRGVDQMRNELSDIDRFAVPHFHTIVVARHN